MLDRDLLKEAIMATDAYLGVEKNAKSMGIATDHHIKDFSYYFSKAHDLLNQLGILNQHEDYMQFHVEEMLKLANKPSGTLANLPGVVLPGHYHSMDEDVDTSDYYLTTSGRKVRKGRITTSKNEKDDNKIDESVESTLTDKANKSKVPLGILRQVFKRGVAAWRTSHRPGTNPTQWGLARVNSYIMKGKTYHTADKDLREEKNELDFTDDELDAMADDLSWEDIIHLYDDEELDFEDLIKRKDKIEETITATSRLQRRMRFARTASKRNVAKFIKLKRASDTKTLQMRAQRAARRALINKLLRGRNKALMSAQEKDMIESQVNRLKSIQQNLAVRMLPRIREIEKQRLAKR